MKFIVIPIPLYQGSLEFSKAGSFPQQIIGFHPSHYMIPYPFMETPYIKPNYQNSYPYLNQNGQLLYSNFDNNNNQSVNKTKMELNQQIQKN